MEFLKYKGRLRTAALMRSDERMQLTRRTFIGGAVTAASGLAASKTYMMYAGTYTGPKSQGIYAWRVDNGKFTSLGMVAETKNPSFLAISADGRHVYAVNEAGTPSADKSGEVTAYSRDPASGKLTLLNAVSSKGAGPCYVSLDKTGKFALVANYGSGSAAVLPIEANGGLREASAFIQHTGSSVNAQRQAGPHAHCIKVSPDNRFVLVSDLGLDQLLVYRFDAKKGSLTPNDPPSGKVKPGSGPRHFAFHPKSPRLYATNEMACTVTAFDWDRKKGSMTELETLPTLPSGVSDEKFSNAEIVVHPNGRFLFASNRGHDSIAIFGIDRTGKLSYVENAPTQGQTPRNFALDPTGAFLLAANQKSDNIVVFRVDKKTGKLTPTGDVLTEAGSPVCVRFVV